jgi:SAM-dependent methyltransferase
MSADFDEHAGSYRDDVNRAIAFSGRDITFFAAHKATLLADLAASAFGDSRDCSILDVGCGVGLIDGPLTTSFREVAGVDISNAELEIATRENPGVTYERSVERELPYDTGSFDVVFAACVFHHVAPDVRAPLAREMCRVARSGGLVAVFEHNPWNPLTRLVVRRTTFDKGVELIRPSELARAVTQPALGTPKISFITFSPFDGAVSRKLERLLSGVPIGAQYVVVARKDGVEQ